MPTKLYLVEPEEMTDGSLTEQAWFILRGAIPLSNEALLAWSEFLKHSEHTRYVYCQHCGMPNEVRYGGYGIRDDQLPSDVLALKQQCIEHGRADWFVLRASGGESAFLASKGKDTFLVAQWGERLHSQEEVVQGAQAKKRIKRYENSEATWSIMSFVLVTGVALVVAKLMGDSEAGFHSRVPAVLVSMFLSVAICIGIFERLKRKIRRQFAFMF